MTLGHYVHTLRHMKPVQVYRRLWFQVHRPRPDGRPAPALRTSGATWTPTCRREQMMEGPTTFRFLNVMRHLTWPRGWNDPAIDHLWLYNLHYFEDLTACDAVRRRVWHAELIERWIQENPPFHGKGWEPYPLSLRIANWIKYDLAGGQLSSSARDALALSVRYLTQRIEYHLLGNHLLANAKALVMAGAYFTGPEADGWLRSGLEILAEQLPEQILADGGHFELSPMYHSIALEDLLDLLNLSATYPGLLPDKVVDAWRETAQRMRHWLQAMCLPDGEIGLFSDAAHGIASSPAEIERYADRLRLPAVTGPSDGITQLATSGYVRLQNADAVLLIDVGEIGPDYLPGHGHADVLTFEMALFGQRFVVNSGTSVYYGNDDQRYAERRTSAHNTVEVDGADSSELWGNFRVARRAHPMDLELGASDGPEMAITCAHSGYQRLGGNVVHRRSWYLGGQILRVQDELSGNYSSATARFHLHPAVECVELHHANVRRLRLLGRSVSLSAEGRAMLWTPTSYHPQFGLSVPNWCWSVDVPTEGTTSTIRWTMEQQGEE